MTSICRHLPIFSSVLSDSSPPNPLIKTSTFRTKPAIPDPIQKKIWERNWKMKSIPELFRCPISLDLFTDPVTLSTGQTYDRASIERWLAYGNSTCPVTMQPLHDTSLLPNHTLRHLIEQWLRAPYGSMTTVNLSALKQNLRSPASSSTTKLETLRVVKSLSSESSSARAGLVQAGMFELLLQVLFQFPIADVNGETTELALDALLYLLPSSDSVSRNMLMKGSNLAQLVFLLDQGNAKIKAGLCCLLEAIATCSATQELSLVLGRTQQVLQVLVSLLLDKSDHWASEASLAAVCSLCSLEANRGNAIREGAIGGLIAYLLSSSGCSPIARSRNGATARAMATLELLSGLDVGKRKMMKTPNAIGVLVKMVFRVPSDQGGSEHAVGSLIQLCCDSARARTEAINAGVLTQLLLLLQSQCSHQAKAKARALLKLLRTMWAKDQGGF